MGFLRRMFGSKPSAADVWSPPPGPISSWPVGHEASFRVQAEVFAPDGRGTVEVVGESHYQGTLERIAGGFDLNGPRDRDHLAMLIPEPANPYDAHAVRVVLTADSGIGGVVGYLSREQAVAYRPIIDRLAAKGQVAACRASLKGGYVIHDTLAILVTTEKVAPVGRRGSIGVTLYLKPPAGLAAELDAQAHPS